MSVEYSFNSVIFKPSLKGLCSICGKFYPCWIFQNEQQSPSPTLAHPQHQFINGKVSPPVSEASHEAASSSQSNMVSSDEEGRGKENGDEDEMSGEPSVWTFRASEVLLNLVNFQFPLPIPLSCCCRYFGETHPQDLSHHRLFYLKYLFINYQNSAGAEWVLQIYLQNWYA